MTPGGKILLASGALLGVWALSRRTASAATAPEVPAGAGYLEARSQSPAPAPAPLDAPPVPAPSSTGGQSVTQYILRTWNEAPRGDPAVFMYQLKLRDLGYSPGILDGRFGQNTRNAMQDFLRSMGVSRLPTTMTLAAAQLIEQAWNEQHGTGTGTGGASSTKGGGELYQPSYTNGADAGYYDAKPLTDYLPADVCAGRVGARARRY